MPLKLLGMNCVKKDSANSFFTSVVGIQESGSIFSNHCTRFLFSIEDR